MTWLGCFETSVRDRDVVSTTDMDHTVLPANYTMPAFTPQPQSVTALWLVLILPSHGG